MSERAAFIGLGAMGYPMAGHLVAKGFDVSVYNRSPAKSEAFAEQHGGRVAKSAANAVEGATFVGVCVYDESDIREVTLGKTGAFAAMAPGSVYVDHATASAQIAREMAAEAETRGFTYLDAPVTGSPEGAQAGNLAVTVGGAAEGLERAHPFLDCYATAIEHMGPSGHGQLTKMVNQITLAGMIESLAEGLNFAVLSGLDTAKVVGILSKGTARSWWLENYGEHMLNYKVDFDGQRASLGKDLGFAVTEARQVGASLPVASLVAQFYVEMARMGGSHWHATGLIGRLRPEKT